MSLAVVHDNFKRMAWNHLGDNRECGICLNEMGKCSDATVFVCSHIVCNGCVSHFRKKICPFCRTELTTKKKVDREKKLLKDKVTSLEILNEYRLKELENYRRIQVELQQKIYALNRDILFLRNDDEEDMDTTVRRVVNYDIPPQEPIPRTPIPDDDDVILLEDYETVEVNEETPAPPTTRGRVRCSLCGELGHNRRNRMFHG